MAEIVIMDFSGIYKGEQFFEGEKVSWLDVREIPGTNCYCDDEAKTQILEKLEEFSAGGIYFIDSGNYHYMTRIWLEKISEPFDLLVFDNHTDMQPPAFGGLLSCGGWIYDSVMELPLLQKVILIGPDEEAFSRVEPEIQKKVEFLSREKLRGMELMEILDFVKEQTGKKPLYISIDKDVLCPEEAATTWSQGDMTLEEMLKVLLALCSHFEKENGKILQVDICGECDSDKSMESPKNDHANKELLRFWKKWF